MKKLYGLNYILITVLGVCFASFSCDQKGDLTDFQNIVFISIDDLRAELNCYGKDYIVSPNIDRLAEHGVLFERAYTQMAICMASRASLFTGYYSDANKIYNRGSVTELMPESLTINKFFQKNGYEIYGIGKLYHGTQDHVAQFGEDYLDNQKWQDNKTIGRGYLTPEAIATIDENGIGPAWEKADVDDDDYRDGHTADWAVKKLKDLKSANKPFFLGIGFDKPHLPFNAPQKYWDLYKHENINIAINSVNHGSIYGENNSQEVRRYSNIPNEFDIPIPEETQKMLKHGYYACVSYIDKQVGKILDALEENDLFDNTVIILWSDHGYKLGEHGMWDKHTNFELDTNIPLIICAPGIKRGVRTNSFAESIDIFPTLIDLCGFKIPGHLEGKSLVPVLINQTHTVKEQAFSIWTSYRASLKDDELIMGYSVRTDQFRYTEWIHLQSGEILDKELYDHHIDPEENNNVIGVSNYSKELPSLEALIKDYRGRKKISL